MLRPFAFACLLAINAAAVLPARSETATIVDSGSTNRPGFRIAIDSSGVAEFTSRKGETAPSRRELPVDIADRFRADLAAASPLGSLPPVRCMKSVSFGSRLTIASGGEQTPDLNCGDGGNAALRNLIRDAKEIIALFQGN